MLFRSTLTAEGFLRQDEETKRYCLGDKLMMLGFCAVQRQRVNCLARDLLWSFFERTGYSVMLTVPCGGQSLCVDRIMSSAPGRATTMSVLSHRFICRGFGWRLAGRFILVQSGELEMLICPLV